MFIYKVKSGDTLTKISNRFSVNQNKIINDNNLSNPFTLLVGECLIIDKDMITYQVKNGDDLHKISDEFNISIDQIKKKNNINNRLKVGQELILDFKLPNKYKIYSNGYSYQNLSSEILKDNNSFLSTISPFAYKIKEDGTLNNFNPSNAIKQNNTPKVMVIANIKEKGGFSSEIAHIILSNRKIKSILINNIISEMKKENYVMLNIDLEYVKPEDKELFIEFIIDMKAKLNEANKKLSVALAPKTSSFQKGLLYEAHDYQQIGKIADYVIIMTYEWGYTYGEPMAVSPLPQVKSVIRYAKTVIPKEKIIMGIPNYGYDWKLPYKKGTAANSVSINEAIEKAKEKKVEIKHSKASLTPYYNYVEDGISHIVHFDDACSYNEKLKLIIKEQIGGLSIWTLSTSNIQLSKLINYYFSLNKF